MMSLVFACEEFPNVLIETPSVYFTLKCVANDPEACDIGSIALPIGGSEIVIRATAFDESSGMDSIIAPAVRWSMKTYAAWDGWDLAGIHVQDTLALTDSVIVRGIQLPRGIPVPYPVELTAALAKTASRQAPLR